VGGGGLADRAAWPRGEHPGRNGYAGRRRFSNEQWDSLKNAYRRILDIIEREVSHTSIKSLKLFREHPDDPVCLKAVLLQSLQEEWPEDD
jgi:hypothetical protein